MRPGAAGTRRRAGGAGAAAALVLALAACGKRGDPLPPLPTNPQPVTSLRLAQRADQLQMSLVAPRATAGGVRLGVLEVETVRLDGAGDLQKTGRHTRRRVAPGETFTEQGTLPAPGMQIRIAARAIARGQASGWSPVATLTVQPAVPAPHDLTAALQGEAVAVAWQGVVPSPPPTPPPSPSPSPSPAAGPTPSPAAGPASSPTAGRPPSPTAVPSGSPRPGVSPPPGKTVVPSPAAPPKPAGPTRGFWVYRRNPLAKFGAPIQSTPQAANAFLDRTVALGESWCYAVTTVVATDPAVESAPSNESCLAVKDITPPAPPAGVSALAREDAVEVSWSPSAEADLAGYRIYRAEEGGQPARVAEAPATETSWRDTAAGQGAPRYYAVSAYDKAGNESPPSAPVEAHRP